MSQQFQMKNYFQQLVNILLFSLSNSFIPRSFGKYFLNWHSAPFVPTNEETSPSGYKKLPFLSRKRAAFLHS